MRSRIRPAKIKSSLFDNARRKYLPSKIRLLIIAESPPASGGFFYFPKTIGKDHLFRETMKTVGLWPQTARMHTGINKVPMLRRFQSMGFYLIDTCAVPVDKMQPIDRRQSVLNALPRLVRDVNQADPKNIVIVKTTIFTPVRTALEEAALGPKVLNRQPVPFPSHGNQQKYRSMMKRLLDQAHLVKRPC